MRLLPSLSTKLRRRGRFATAVNAAQAQILCALADGRHLKCHRTLEGSRIHRLHDASGQALSVVSASDVEMLEARGLIAGNMKFPAAAYMLTEQGARLVASLMQYAVPPSPVRMPAEPHTS